MHRSFGFPFTWPEFPFSSNSDCSAEIKWLWTLLNTIFCAELKVPECFRINSCNTHYRNWSYIILLILSSFFSISGHVHVHTLKNTFPVWLYCGFIHSFLASRDLKTLAVTYISANSPTESLFDYSALPIIPLCPFPAFLDTSTNYRCLFSPL